MKNIVITGVSSGIGYYTARELTRKGYRVFGSVRRQDDAARLVRELGELFIPLIFDLTDHQAIRSAALKVGGLIGKSTLNALINNAGSTEGGPLIHYSIEKFRQHLEVLVTGQLAVTQAFLPLLKAGEGSGFSPGKIMMISSTSGKAGFPFVGPYAASKHALEGLSKSLRGELLIYGIDVIVIGPGNIRTPIWEKNTKEKIEQYKETDYHLPLVRMHNYLEKTIPKDSLDPEWFGRKLVAILERKKSKARYTIVNKPLKHWIITNVLPAKLKAKIVAGILGMKKAKE